MSRPQDLYIVLLSVHGLLRGEEPELGRDPDTGGQITYVLELARELIGHPDVGQVDLVTRWIADPTVSTDYSRPVEPLAPGLSIVRIASGPRRYVRKEQLWSTLDGFADNLVHYLRSQHRAPDLVHGHYADAGYVATRVAGLLDVPMAFTGHSLGRDKKRRLLDDGKSSEAIEKRYHLARRIEAEETALDHASFVVASTHQEVEQQYRQYEMYEPKRMLVVPPGVDLGRFKPARGRIDRRSPLYCRLARFLDDPRKPMILALSRADPRKNIPTLLRAFGENDELREKANLILVAGNRDDIGDLDTQARDVLREMLQLIDRYDLYGSVAYPKHHTRDEVPQLYRLAAKSRGVFVNPALTEPFGLTLLEAAASGVPVVATHDGGPRDIVDRCKNGLLVDPLDSEAMGRALLDALSDRKRWRTWAAAGQTGSRKHFTWNNHVKKYMRATRTAVNTGRRSKFFGTRNRLITADRILISDIDNTLIGDRKALVQLMKRLREAGETVAFGIATGRSAELTRQVIEEWKIPTPQVLITGVGSCIRYGSQFVEDQGWAKHIAYRWRPDALRELMETLPGVQLQGPEGQSAFKISYNVEPETMPRIEAIQAELRRAGLQARLVYSHGAYLDVLPIRASKGMAVRYFSLHWDIPLERCLVAGDSGNDEEMLTGNTLGVVVGNHDPELDKLRDQPHIYFASGNHAWGIMEGLDHYDFLGKIHPPGREEEEAYDAARACR